MKFVFAVICALTASIGVAQNNFCGTSRQDQLNCLASVQYVSQTGRTELAIQYIPIKVHNVSNDNASSFFAAWPLFETLCTLNEDFKASGIQFYLDGDFNYIRNSSWNDHAEFWKGEEMMKASNFPEVVNCYLVSNPAGNCGYFTYTGDAVALNKSCLGRYSHTWAHELGHYFSLPHTFFGWEGINYSSSKSTASYQKDVFTRIENVPRLDCTTQADNFCDTYPDYISNRWSCNNEGKSPLILKDVNDSLFRADGTLFMSYAGDNCMNRFSNDQINAMMRSIEGPRKELKRLGLLPKFIEKAPIILNTPSAGDMTETRNVLFSWEPVTNAKYYVLQISRTSNFSVVIKNLLLTKPYELIDSLIQGKDYWWRVRAYSDFDFCGTESAVGVCKTKAVLTSDENLKIVNGRNVQPNPAKLGSMILLEVPFQFDHVLSLDLIALNGKHIPVKDFEVRDQNVLLKIDEPNEGLFILQLNTNNGNTNSKIILTH